MRIYLAGPMRGYQQFNFPAFDAAQASLEQMGHTVYSPAAHDRESGFDGTDPDAYFDMAAAFRWDIGRVLAADAIYLLKGWKRSTGAKLEYDVARMTGKRLFFEGATPVPRARRRAPNSARLYRLSPEGLAALRPEPAEPAVAAIARSFGVPRELVEDRQ